MTYKEAAEYLQPIMDNCELSQYAKALEKAIEALTDIDRLLVDLHNSTDRCKFCENMKKPLTCLGSDYFCNECFQHTCVCRDCQNGSKWTWDGGSR